MRKFNWKRFLFDSSGPAEATPMPKIDDAIDKALSLHMGTPNKRVDFRFASVNATLAELTSAILQRTKHIQNDLSERGIGLFLDVSPAVSGELSDLEPLAQLNCQALDLNHSRYIRGNLKELQCFSSLCSLGLSCRSIEGALSSLSPLRKIRALNLWGCDKIGGSLSDLTSLKKMRVLVLKSCGNLAGTLNDCSNFPELEFLQLENCSMIGGAIEGLQDLKNLEHLYLSKCHSITGSPGDLPGGKKLRYVMIDNCSGVQGSLEGIEACKGLLELTVSETPVTGSLNDLKDIALDTIRLFSCSSITVNLDTLRQFASHRRQFNSRMGIEDTLKSIFLVGYKTGIHESILEKGNAKEILSAALRGSELHRVKVVLLGEPRAGKSWLRMSFFEDQKPSKDDKTLEFEVVDATRVLTVNNVEFDMRVWDFAGDHVLHGTHELFLAGSSIHLLILDVRRTLQDNKLEYWSRLIKHHQGAGAALIVLVAQCDQSPSGDSIGTIDPELHIQIPSELSQTPRVVDSFSAKTKQGFDKLEAELTELVASREEFHGMVMSEIPPLIDIVQEELLDKATVSLEEYRKLCRDERVGISDEDLQEDVLRTLHDLGFLFFFGLTHFERDQKAQLFQNQIEYTTTFNEPLLPPGRKRWYQAERDTLLRTRVFNPKWLPKILYGVMESVAARARGQFADAFFTVEDIRSFVKVRLENRHAIEVDDAAAAILGVLKLYDLCLPSLDGSYFFPRALPEEIRIPEWARTHNLPQSSRSDLYAEITDIFVPEQVLQRLIIGSYRPGTSLPLFEDLAWRFGMVIARDGNLATFGYDRSDSKLWVQFAGNSMEQKLSIFRDLCKEIYKESFGEFGSEKQWQCSWLNSDQKASGTHGTSKSNQFEGHSKPLSNSDAPDEEIYFLILAQLMEHHQLENDECNRILPPMEGKEIAQLAGIRPNQVTQFWKSSVSGKSPSSQKEYKRFCNICDPRERGSRELAKWLLETDERIKAMSSPRQVEGIRTGGNSQDILDQHPQREAADENKQDESS